MAVRMTEKVLLANGIDLHRRDPGDYLLPHGAGQERALGEPLA
jgi:hypothetical protein